MECVKRVVLLLTMLFAIMGCQSGKGISVEQVEELLEERAYQPLKLNQSQNFEHQERPWLCLCSELNGQQYIVVISPSAEWTEIPLGMEGRLTYEQIAEVLVREGLVSDIERMDLNNLNPGLTDDTPIHWYYHDVSGDRLHRFDLEGERISQTSFSGR
ncbi:hypothetical protein MKX64_08820 [Paenibacillus sp. FSL M8-0334]|uniref:Uncharacterized protein n=2 Tax=Paenibacillus TaxID=44249 RepID=A0A268EZ21_9BACL|nr:hypothetical protein CHH67_06330 [Paenibacillus campinasensis]PAK52335.1 hypothetical protein CHH75_12550 [Paenibacillus sp. 7541]